MQRPSKSVWIDGNILAMFNIGNSAYFMSYVPAFKTQRVFLTSSSRIIASVASAEPPYQEHHRFMIHMRVPGGEDSMWTPLQCLRGDSEPLESWCRACQGLVIWRAPGCKHACNFGPKSIQCGLVLSLPLH